MTHTLSMTTQQSTEDGLRGLMATLLTTEQAAELIGVHRACINRWVLEGKLVAIYEAPRTGAKAHTPFRLFTPESVRAVPDTKRGRPRGRKTSIPAQAVKALCPADWDREGN